MRPAPKWTEFPQCPVIAGTAILAIAVTIAWWSRLDASPLFETAMIRRGELWRLITAIFPHTNPLPLAFNIYWLWVFGAIVEQVYGHLRTAALLALFALGSSSLEFAFSLGGVGLSGVGYGSIWLISSINPFPPLPMTSKYIYGTTGSPRIVVSSKVSLVTEGLKGSIGLGP